MTFSKVENGNMNTDNISCSPPSWLNHGLGKGPSNLGNASRVAKTVGNKLKDIAFGPIPGTNVSRTSLMKTKQLTDFLEKLQVLCKKNHLKNVQFSHYTSATPIQDLTAEEFTSHVRSLTRNIPNMESQTWIFPIHVRKTQWFGESDHMTVVLVTQGNIEYYDPLGFSMAEQEWIKPQTLDSVASIIYRTIFSIEDKNAPTPLDEVNLSKLHQSDIKSCGFWVAAWLHHRVYEGMNNTDWKNKLRTTDDYAIRAQIDAFLRKEIDDSTELNASVTKAETPDGAENSEKSPQMESELDIPFGTNEIDLELLE